MQNDPRFIAAKGGDRFFSDQQISRLKELTAARRAARDAGAELPAAELGELDALIMAELEATIERCKELLRQQRASGSLADNTGPDQPGA